MKRDKGEYRTVLLDHEGCYLAEQVHDTEKRATKAAKLMLTDREYVGEAFKVEVLNWKDECLFDLFANKADDEEQQE